MELKYTDDIDPNDVIDYMAYDRTQQVSFNYVYQ